MAHQSPFRAPATISTQYLQQTHFAYGTSASPSDTFVSTTQLNYKSQPPVVTTPNGHSQAKSSIVFGQETPSIESTTQLNYPEHRVETPKRYTKDLQKSVVFANETQFERPKTSYTKESFPGYRDAHSSDPFYNLKQSQIQFGENQTNYRPTTADVYRAPPRGSAPQRYSMDLQKSHWGMGPEKDFSSTTKDAFKPHTWNQHPLQQMIENSSRLSSSQVEFGREKPNLESTTRDSFRPMTAAREQGNMNTNTLQKSHIEFGDRDKVKEHINSTQKESYAKPPAVSPPRRDFVTPTTQSHFELGAAAPSSNASSTSSWSTTNRSSFTPPAGTKAPTRYSMDLQRTHFSLSERGKSYEVPPTTTQSSFSGHKVLPTDIKTPMETNMAIRSSHFDLGQDRTLGFSNYLPETRAAYQEPGPASPVTVKQSTHKSSIPFGDPNNTREFTTTLKSTYTEQNGLPAVPPHGRHWLRATHFQMGGTDHELESTYGNQFVQPVAPAEWSV